MLTLLYVMTILTLMLPWSYTASWIGLSKLRVMEVVKELRLIENEYKTLNPQEKKAKILEERAGRLKRRLNNFFLVNLLCLWVGVFVSMMVSEYMYFYLMLTNGG
ncbi:MAG: hypothetical protein QXM76_00015, partial [Zestosphaera sp.]